MDVPIREDICDNTTVHESDYNNLKQGWMTGVFGCLKPVMSIIKVNGISHPSDQDEWDIPYEKIKVLEFLGRGGQGTVHLAIIDNRYVAVKKVSDLKEIDVKNLRKLNHPNIIKFQGVCTQPNHYYIVMEFCPHGPLYDLLRNEGSVITPFRVSKWAKEISNGMQYLHSHKIIHRDLKSPNVLIGDHEIIKISDFGTSRTWNEMSTRMSFAGTVAWMAPEAISERPCSEKIDVWSFGIVLWEMLTCEIPYKNMEQSAIMYLVGSGQLHPPIPNNCPDGFKLIMEMCWKYNPKDRPNFKLIYSHLEIATTKIISDYEQKEEAYFENQKQWQAEISTKIESYIENVRHFCLEYQLQDEKVSKRLETEFKQIEEVRKTLQSKLDDVLKLQIHYETLIKKHRNIFEIQEQGVATYRKRAFPTVFKRARKKENDQDSTTSTSPDSPSYEENSNLIGIIPSEHCKTYKQYGRTNEGNYSSTSTSKTWVFNECETELDLKVKGIQLGSEIPPTFRKQSSSIPINFKDLSGFSNSFAAEIPKRVVLQDTREFDYQQIQNCNILEKPYLDCRLDSHLADQLDVLNKNINSTTENVSNGNVSPSSCAMKVSEESEESFSEEETREKLRMKQRSLSRRYGKRTPIHKQENIYGSQENFIDIENHSIDFCNPIQHSIPLHSHLERNAGKRKHKYHSVSSDCELEFNSVENCEILESQV